MTLFVRLTIFIALGLLALVLLGFVLKLVLIAVIVAAVVVAGRGIALALRRRRGELTVVSRR